MSESQNHGASVRVHCASMSSKLVDLIDFPCSGRALLVHGNYVLKSVKKCCVHFTIGWANCDCFDVLLVSSCWNIDSRRRDEPIITMHRFEQHNLWHPRKRSLYLCVGRPSIQWNGYGQTTILILILLFCGGTANSWCLAIWNASTICESPTMMINAQITIDFYAFVHYWFRFLL